MSAGIKTPTTTPPTSPPVASGAGGQVERHLKLVFSADASPPQPLRSARDAAVMPASSRALKRSVLAYALQQGQSVSADALSVVLAAKAVNHPGPATLLTEDMVWGLVWTDVMRWCSHRGIEIPDRVPETVWLLINYLVATNTLHPDSDFEADLRAPLLSSGGLAPSGRSRIPTNPRR